jgi:cyanate permease
MVGVAGGPAAMGLIFGYTENYQLPYMVVGMLGFAAAIVFLMARPPESIVNQSENR